ncbi:MAG: hypothetical protein U1E62_21595 [Alsobacter sp.]
MDDFWTPKLVKEQLTDAIRWVQRTGGPTGPAGMSTLMPAFVYDADDIAAQDELPKEETGARQPTLPSTVTRFEAVLYWPAVYLYDLPGPRRVLRVWMRGKATRQPFNQLCKARKWSRATANRALDKAIATIGVGLTRDGVPPP